MHDRGFTNGAGLHARPAHPSDLNLLARAASALVLAMIALAANLIGAPVFAVLVGVLALLMAWEWGQVVRRGRNPAILVTHAATLCAAVALTASGFALPAVVVLFCGALTIAALASVRGDWLSAMGAFYVGLPVVALIWLRTDSLYGATAILLIFFVVWAADTGAFVAGKLIGGAKLWPSVSPNKTWSGLAGGMLASTLVAVSLASVLPNASPLWLAMCGVILGAMAQAGDLGESALKRFCGVKDASELIPGHGGFMDRLDSLVSVAVAAGLIGLVAGAGSPARAVLFGN